MKNHALALLLTATLPLAAQTAAHPPVHHTATGLHADSCVRLPEISAKIAALPAGTPCAKSLMTFTSTPNVKLTYVSPMVTPEVKESLGLDPTSFSLDYSEIKVGSGPLALPHKFYTVQYTGYLTDGTKFDSSLDRPEPFTFPIGQHKVIAGWDLGTQGMHIGGKRRLYVPWQLAYGDRGNPPVIPAKAELVFDIELLSQSDEAPKPKTPPAPPAPTVKPNTATPPAPKTGTPAPATPPPATSTTPPATTPKQ